MKQNSLLGLPTELRLAIYDAFFEDTPQDYPGTRRAELRIYDDHVMLRRICPSPPPRWKGARSLMCIHPLIYEETLGYLYSQMEFHVRIKGDQKDPGPLRNRLNSEYPLGRLDACPPLRYITKIRLLLDAWSVDEIRRLKKRLRKFLDAVQGGDVLDVQYIGFYFDDRMRWSKSGQSPISESDEVALMLSGVRGKHQVIEVYDPNRTVSRQTMGELLQKINGRDCTHVPFKRLFGGFQDD